MDAGVVTGVLLVLATAALVVWFVANRKHPEAESGHLRGTTDDWFAPAADERDRPGGPDQEPMLVVDRGQHAAAETREQQRGVTDTDRENGTGV